jgi:hypothetical protein
MPYAANVTAHDSSTNQPLQISFSNKTGITVDLGAARASNYTFVINFDMKYGLWNIGTWNSNYFYFGWQESSWGTFHDGYHAVPTSFQISLPAGAAFVDSMGINNIAPIQNITEGARSNITFAETLAPQQTFGWVILYHDAVYKNANPQPASSNSAGTALRIAQAQPIPLLSMTVGSFSIWSAVMSILLLTGSELLSPVYARTGVVINRKRMRIAALILVALFLIASCYQVIAISQPVTTVGH